MRSGLGHKRTVFAPFSVKDPDEFNSPLGYVAERANRGVGRIVGGVSGGTLGGVAGRLLGRGGRPVVIRNIRMNPRAMFGTAIGALAGALLGRAVGDKKSLNDTERLSGVNETDAERYLLRGLGRNSNLGEGGIIDYIVSRPNYRDINKETIKTGGVMTLLERLKGTEKTASANNDELVERYFINQGFKSVLGEKTASTQKEEKSLLQRLMEKQ